MTAAPTEIDIAAYRGLHGPESLGAFFDLATTKVVVVIHHDTECVQIVDTDSLNERVVAACDFKLKFRLFLQDDSAFYFGNKEAIESATRMLQAINAAVQFCLTGQPDKAGQVDLAIALSDTSRQAQEESALRPRPG